MESRDQNSSESFSYLLFASAIMMVLIACSGFTLSVRAKSPKEAGAPPSNAAALRLPVPEATAFSAATLQERARLEVEQITLHPSGFEPDEMTRPQGRFVLSVHNRSGLDAVELKFESENGSRVSVLQSRRRKLSWADEVDLPAGRYLLWEANHPEWRCLITITAR